MVTEISTPEDQPDLPIKQPPRKSRRRYFTPQESEQLLLLQKATFECFQAVSNILIDGKFSYSEPGQLNITALDQAVTHLTCVIKLMLESGNVDRNTIRKLQRQRILLMLKQANAQGEITELRISNLNKRML